MTREVLDQSSGVLTCAISAMIYLLHNLHCWWWLFMVLALEDEASWRLDRHCILLSLSVGYSFRL